MKTNTKSQILEILKKKGPTRPVELVNTLKISAQAVHRHLRMMLSKGKIEMRGSSPTTFYILIDTPDFHRTLKWYCSSSNIQMASEICETRDVFSARLSHFIPLVKQGFSEADLPLLISVVGEIGNNSFDHNLGQWQDIPGCWLEIQVTTNFVWTMIADRGQGVHCSLSKVIPDLSTDQIALEKAFEEQISGRSFENRGNGLKFVKNVILSGSNRGIACRSGKGIMKYGEMANKCAFQLSQIKEQNFGTITIIAWRKK